MQAIRHRGWSGDTPLLRAGTTHLAAGNALGGTSVATGLVLSSEASNARLRLCGFIGLDGGVGSASERVGTGGESEDTVTTREPSFGASRHEPSIASQHWPLC